MGTVNMSSTSSFVKVSYIFQYMNPGNTSGINQTQCLKQILICFVLTIFLVKQSNFYFFLIIVFVVIIISAKCNPHGVLGFSCV